MLEFKSTKQVHLGLTWLQYYCFQKEEQPITIYCTTHIAIAVLKYFTLLKVSIWNGSIIYLNSYGFG